MTKPQSNRRGPHALAADDAGATGDINISPRLDMKLKDDRFCAAMKRAGYEQASPVRSATADVRVIRHVFAVSYVPTASCADI